MSARLKAGLLIVTGVVLTAFFVVVAPKGHFTIDEGIYHLMVENFTSGNGPFVWNGYEEFPSPELTLRFLRPHDGRLSAQYPFLYAILFAPFYLLFGMEGLFLPNILGFGATVALTFVLARQLFDDIHLALNAALVLLFATFLVEYGPGIWPHASTAALGTAAFCLVVHGVRSSASPGRWVASAAGGFALGLAIGLRFDALLLMVGLGVPLIGMGTARLSRTAWFVGGLVPPLAALTLANGVRFGAWTPFSYGSDASNLTLTTYLPLAGLGAAFVLVAWLVTRPAARDTMRRHPFRLPALFAGVVTLLLVLPGSREILLALARGAWVLVVDLRGYSGLEPMRGPGGGIIFYHSFKKSLLQSCPYLAVLAVPIWVMFRQRNHRRQLLTMVAAIVPVVLSFSYREWHGGLSFNMRYFTAILPFAAILTAHGLHDIGRGMSRAAWRKALPLLFLAAVMALGVALSRPVLDGSATPLELREHLVLTAPLGIAGLLFVTVALWLIRGRPANAWSQRLAVAFLAAGLAWSSATAYASDLRWSLALRHRNLSIARAGNAALGPNSILFAGVPHPFSALTERGVRLAYPLIDDYEDFIPLMEYHVAAGRRAYVLSWDLERFCGEGGRLPPGYTILPILSHAGMSVLELQQPGNRELDSRSVSNRSPAPSGPSRGVGITLQTRGIPPGPTEPCQP